MAGIYIHIPFCRKKCHYCDFYKTTLVGKKPLFLEALLKEAEINFAFPGFETIETIYFGGGTPSVLSVPETDTILRQLQKVFKVDPSAEITFEANPDDLSPEYLKNLRQTGINRLSIGIQSFYDAHLRFMNRRHNAGQASACVRDASNAGFSDISIDLIYGFPGLTRLQWKENLCIAAGLPVDHISAYHLTWHEGTVFKKRMEKGVLSEIREEESIDQFEDLIRLTADAGFEQYEISNFARNQCYSKHNCSYWQGKTYLGLGPSAHSFNGFARRWNVSGLDDYIISLQSGILPCETEVLSEKDKLNDYLITGLRTKWGISPEHIRKVSGNEWCEKILQAAKIFLNSGCLKESDGIITMTPKGFMISDQIMLRLFIE